MWDVSLTQPPAQPLTQLPKLPDHQGRLMIQMLQQLWVSLSLAYSWFQFLNFLSHIKKTRWKETSSFFFGFILGKKWVCGAEGIILYDFLQEVHRGVLLQKMFPTVTLFVNVDYITDALALNKKDLTDKLSAH